MKLFLTLFFSLAFFFIIIAPTTILIKNMKMEIAMFFQLDEDDQKEETQEVVDKGVFVNENQLNSALADTRTNSVNIFSVRYVDYSLEIFLPPPR